jgi:hypothetical protein
MSGQLDILMLVALSLHETFNGNAQPKQSWVETSIIRKLFKHEIFGSGSGFPIQIPS